MDNYIVRIYRRDSEDPARIAGMIEVVKSSEQRPFTNSGELKDILVSIGKKRAARKQKAKVLK